MSFGAYIYIFFNYLIHVKPFVLYFVLFFFSQIVFILNSVAKLYCSFTIVYHIYGSYNWCIYSNFMGFSNTLILCIFVVIARQSCSVAHAPRCSVGHVLPGPRGGERSELSHLSSSQSHLVRYTTHNGQPLELPIKADQIQLMGYIRPLDT